MPGKTVLVVDDIAEQRHILVTLLRYSGYEFLEATDGKAAIQMAREQHPDLILMDAGLPVLDGWEATEQLKQDSTTSHIPVIMLTAYALDVHRARALQAGCDSYLTRPVAPRHVLEEIQQLIGPA
ncbi:MAG: response regulator [Gemmatimonadetes bacterium]|jgi:CheY-like chemotaxis protein|nr:response regulator [Gemmatimonadota bacterium]